MTTGLEWTGPDVEGNATSSASVAIHTDRLAGQRNVPSSVQLHSKEMRIHRSENSDARNKHAGFVLEMNRL